MAHLKAINWDHEMVLMTEMADHLGIGSGSLMDRLMAVQRPKGSALGVRLGIVLVLGISEGVGDGSVDMDG